MSPIIKRKKEKFYIPSKYILLALSVLCLGTMVVSLTVDLSSTPLHNVVGFAVVPFQKGITSVTTFLHDKADELGSLKLVLEENEELKLQIAQQNEQIIQLQQDKYELQRLRDLFDLSAMYPEYEKVGARIIAKDAGNWFHSFTIDKGLEDGLELDYNVIASGGLVGHITDIGPNWAKVTTIIDDTSNVSGKILSTSDHLIVSGNLEYMNLGAIAFSQLLDSDDLVTIGDKIVTSNISSKYLPGIAIGYISQITLDSNNLTKSGMLIPFVDFAHLEEVLIIKQHKQVAE